MRDRDNIQTPELEDLKLVKSLIIYEYVQSRYEFLLR